MDVDVDGPGSDWLLPPSRPPTLALETHTHVGPGGTLPPLAGSPVAAEFFIRLRRRQSVCPVGKRSPRPSRPVQTPHLCPLSQYHEFLMNVCVREALGCINSH